MERIAEKNFLIGDPHNLSQYVRGELFILIDAILTSPQVPSTPDDLRACVDFLENFIIFFIKYIKILPLFLREVWTKIKDYKKKKLSILKLQLIQSKNIDPLLYLKNEKVAAAFCYREMFNSMVKIFGGYGSRCSKFYQVWTTNLWNYAIILI